MRPQQRPYEHGILKPSQMVDTNQFDYACHESDTYNSPEENTNLDGIYLIIGTSNSGKISSGRRCHKKNASSQLLFRLQILPNLINIPRSLYKINQHLNSIEYLLKLLTFKISRSTSTTLISSSEDSILHTAPLNGKATPDRPRKPSSEGPPQLTRVLNMLDP